MQAIHILSLQLELLGEIAGYTSLRLRRKFREAGDFEMQLPLAHPMAGKIARDVILCPAGEAHKAMLVEEITKNEGGDTLIVRGYTLSGLLRRRVCIPPDAGEGTFGYDRIIADAESVMRHYVENNVTKPESPARRMPSVALEESNLHRGLQSLPWSARFEQLDTLLAAISAYCDAGFTIVPDFTARCLRFLYLPGRDMTGKNGAQRVTFGVHMGNVTGTAMSEAAQQQKNAAIVGGAGEDENRLILSVCPGGETGENRREVFVDAGSLQDPAELASEGERKLAQTPLSVSIRADVLDTPACRYGAQWELGDLVTVVSCGMQMDARITQVQETHEAGRAARLEATFGEPAGGLERALRARPAVR